MARSPGRAWRRSSFARPTTGGPASFVRRHSYLIIYSVVELLLVRHALPVRRELTVGAADPELSDDGHAPGRPSGRRTSPTKHRSTRSTPARCGAPTRRRHRSPTRFGLDVVIDDAVAEWDRHSNEYVPIEELKAANDPRWQAMCAASGPRTTRRPSSSPERVVGAIEQLIDEHRGERIAVVCHGGVINSYLAHVLGLPTAASSTRTTPASTASPRRRRASARS